MIHAGSTAHSRLADLVGPSRIIMDPAQLAPYEVDGMRPGAALQPESSGQIVEIIKFAAAEKLGVIPTSGRTKLNIGLSPTRYDLALDMSSLNKIVAYDPGDLTLSVEPGLRITILGETLAKHDQFLPLTAPYHTQTTIGGIVASGVDGPLRQLYGTVRDYLLGVEFVTGEGIAAKSGGRVVKNVTGYDIHKLMIGALGSLGIITRLNFKTFPVPTASRGFVTRFSSLAKACDMRNRIADSQLTPLTIEILSPGLAELLESDAASRFVSEPMPVDVLSSTEWALIVGYAGSEKVRERYHTDLQRIAFEAGGVGAIVPEKALAAAFARKREFVPIALASSPATIIVKMSVLPARLNEALITSQKVAENNGLKWATLARGLGIIYFVLLPAAQDDETARRIEKATNAIHDACAKLGGQSTIPWCLSAWKKNLKIWGLDNPNFPQMQKVKTVFDPQGILSPGRFVGGL